MEGGGGRGSLKTLPKTCKMLKMSTFKVQNIQKSFGKLQVLDRVSFDITKGGIVAILGPNGSGKTTFLKILLGMVIADYGSILYEGKDISRTHKYRKNIGYLPQIAQFPDNLKVKEVISMIMDIREEPANSKYLITLFGLEKYLDQKLSNLLQRC